MNISRLGIRPRTKPFVSGRAVNKEQTKTRGEGKILLRLGKREESDRIGLRLRFYVPHLRRDVFVCQHLPTSPSSIADRTQEGGKKGDVVLTTAGQGGYPFRRKRMTAPGMSCDSSISFDGARSFF